MVRVLEIALWSGVFLLLTSAVASLTLVYGVKGFFLGGMLLGALVVLITAASLDDLENKE